jgi:DNA-binding transcriptional regulator YhcF (GntR family)
VALSWLTEVGAEIDRGADVPIGVQFAWALRAAIDTGRLQPGERLPPARELAAAAGVNVNTLRTVLARLEREGYITARHGSGTFVADTPPRQPGVAGAVADATRVAASSGLAPRALSSALYGAVEQPAADPDGQRRRELRQDIVALERMFVELRERHPEIDLSTIPLPTARGPRIQAAEELEDLRRALVQRPPPEEPAAPKRVPAKRRPRAQPKPAVS